MKGRPLAIVLVLALAVVADFGNGQETLSVKCEDSKVFMVYSLTATDNPDLAVFKKEVVENGARDGSSVRIEELGLLDFGGSEVDEKIRACLRSGAKLVVHVNFEKTDSNKYLAVGSVFVGGGGLDAAGSPVYLGLTWQEAEASREGATRLAKAVTAEAKLLGMVR
jgi:hypothetical protein